MEFTIEGRIHPYVHRTYYGKNSARASAYHASQNAIRVQLKNQMQLRGWTMIPNGVPLRLHIEVLVPHGLHKFDATNAQKAVEDAMQGVVFKNDCWVDMIVTTRRLNDAADEYMTYLEVATLERSGES